MKTPDTKKEIKDRIRGLKEKEKKEKNPYRQKNINKLRLML